MNITIRFSLIVIILLLVSTDFVVAQNGSTDILYFEKKELNNGLVFYENSEREELRTDVSKFYEELTFGLGAYQFKNSHWNFLDYKQDFLEFNFQVGPFYGTGNWMDSIFVENIKADQSQFGIRTNVSAHYASRYYYNSRNYTIIEVRGWARYDWYKQYSEGTSIDSNAVVTNFDERYNTTKFRYGFEAQAGWGWGRLNPMNNYMLAQYFMEKYYAGRNFSEEEIRQVATEIYKIKGQRDIFSGHNAEVEAQLVSDFFNEKLILETPDNLEEEWKMAEFMPRLNGKRLEVGPFFKYYNREPDFIYGGYIKYENAKYKGVKWNRNFGATLKYNRYKKQDWANAVVNIGWSYFPDLKQQIDFGVKYVPGVELNNFEDVENFNHGLIPYFGYFSQINAKSRVNLALAYRISGNKKLMIPGPEFSLSVYRSRY